MKNLSIKECSQVSGAEYSCFRLYTDFRFAFESEFGCIL